MLHSLTFKYAVKIQCLIRMRQARKKYLAKIKSFNGRKRTLSIELYPILHDENHIKTIKKEQEKQEDLAIVSEENIIENKNLLISMIEFIDNKTPSLIKSAGNISIQGKNISIYYHYLLLLFNIFI